MHSIERILNSFLTRAVEDGAPENAARERLREIVERAQTEARGGTYVSGRPTMQFDLELVRLPDGTLKWVDDGYSPNGTGEETKDYLR